jgi:hypothetical protein
MPVENAPGLRVLGKLTFEPTDPPRPAGQYVLQRVKAGHGNVASDPTGTLQVRAYVTGTNPRTPAQLALRARVRAGNVAWHALTDAEKAEWKPEGEARRITGYNAFISAFLRGLLSGPAFSGLAHGMLRGPVARALVGQPLGEKRAHGILRGPVAPATVHAAPGSYRTHTVHVPPRLTRAPDPVRGAMLPVPRVHWLALSAMPGRTRGTLRAHGSTGRMRKI